MEHGLISLDFGNSNPHAGFFKKRNQTWELVKVCKLNEFKEVAEQLHFTPHNAQLVLSEVKNYDTELFELQSQGYLLTRVKDYWRGERFAGMPVNYTNLLGQDRLISSFWAYKNLQRPTLIIDAGTYLTIDVVTPAGFQGGYIIPSVQSYLGTFQNAQNLKSFDVKEKAPFAFPHNTEDAILGGYHAFFLLGEKLITDFNIETIIISGGRNQIWDEWSKTQKCEVLHKPHLIHRALIHWMSTQVEIS